MSITSTQHLIESKSFIALAKKQIEPTRILHKKKDDELIAKYRVIEETRSIIPNYYYKWVEKEQLEDKRATAKVKALFRKTFCPRSTVFLELDKKLYKTQEKILKFLTSKIKRKLIPATLLEYRVHIENIKMRLASQKPLPCRSCSPSDVAFAKKSRPASTSIIGQKTSPKRLIRQSFPPEKKEFSLQYKNIKFASKEVTGKPLPCDIVFDSIGEISEDSEEESRAGSIFSI